MTSDEPIAIIGMACRWPGASSVTEFERLLYDGVSAQSDVPSSYYNVEGFHHPDKNRPGSIQARKGYFLNNDTRNFQHEFFGINPVEAKSMDPQQRQLLEVSYECFESAGIPLAEISGSSTGCFVGNFTWEHSLQRFRDPEFATTSPYGATGSATTLLSNRLSYTFNMKGPSLTLDTACSSSLFALHAACNAIRSGDCSAALVGGVNLILGVDVQMDSTKLGVLSPTATCHTFDSRANGYARAEGVGAIFVKKLSDALAAGDTVQAVIRGIAVNSNGKTSGITQPSPQAQEAVIRAAYQKANISNYHDTAYFECHGTGTPTGDPLEINAIGKVFRDATQPLLIGSLKPNIGHGEAASGLASIMKAVIILKNMRIPPTIGIQTLNPNVDFSGNNVRVVRKETQLCKDRCARVSVNSFGFGGANAHAVLESLGSFLGNLKGERTQGTVQSFRLSAKSEGVWANPTCVFHGMQNGIEKPTNPYLLVLSAYDRVTLRKNMELLSKVAQQYSSYDLADTLNMKRTRLQEGAFVVVQDDGIEAALKDAAYGRIKKSPRVGRSIAFVFTGQGAQWIGMGKSLMLSNAKFESTIKEMSGILQDLPDKPSWKLEDIILGNSSRVDEAVIAQPLCTAIQIGLVRVLSDWNLHPTVTSGHSSGEIAAAYAAGLLTAREAILLAYYRGLTAGELKTDGAMLAVGLGAEEVRPYISDTAGVTIACFNSRKSVTLSGKEHAIKEVQEALSREPERIFARVLKTDGKAYHSVSMTAAGETYIMLVQNALSINPSVSTWSTIPSECIGKLPMVSSVTGDILTGPVSLEYWRRNLESPVLFEQAIRLMLFTYKCDTIVEIGPHSALQQPIQQIVRDYGGDSIYHSTLRRGEDSTVSMLRAAGSFFLGGHSLDFTAVNPPPPTGRCVRLGRIVDLPPYSWNYGDVLHDENRLNYRYRTRKHPRHDLLGSRLPYGGTSAFLWRNVLRVEDIPWIKGHQVQNRVVFPAAGYICSILEAALQILELQDETLQPTSIKSYTISNMIIGSALVLDEFVGTETLISLAPQVISSTKSSSLWYEWKVLSTSAGIAAKEKWTQNANGKIAVELWKDGVDPIHSARHIPEDLSGLISPRHNKINPSSTYQRMDMLGFKYGPSFQGLQEPMLWDRHDQTVKANVNLHLTPELDIHESRYVVHPIVVDTCLQTIPLAAARGDIQRLKMQLPVFAGSFVVEPGAVGSNPEQGTVKTWSNPTGLRSDRAGFNFICPEVRMSCKDLTMTTVESNSLQESTTNMRHPYLDLVWKPDIEKLSTSVLQELTARRPSSSNCDSAERDYKTILKLMELYVHKSPNHNILQIGGSSFTPAALEILRSDSPLRFYESYTVFELEEADHRSHSHAAHIRKLQDIDASKRSFSLVIIPTIEKGVDNLSHLQAFAPYMVPATRIIVPTALWNNPDARKRFEIMNWKEEHIMDDLSVFRYLEPGNPPHHSPNKEFIFLQRPSQYTRFLEPLQQIAKGLSWKLRPCVLGEDEIPWQANVVSFIDFETEEPILDGISSQQLACLQHLTANAATIIWVTSLEKKASDALIVGFSRNQNLEQPKLEFQVFRLGNDLTLKDFNRSISLIWSHITDVFSTNLRERIIRDREYVEIDGIVHVSRLVPDVLENKRFTSLVSYGGSIPELVPVQVGGSKLKMEIESVGQPESIFFQRDQAAYRQLEDDYIEIEVSVAGVNFKDIAVIMGWIDNPGPKGKRSYSYNLERGGTVTRVGSSVHDLKPGDLVVSAGPGFWGTVEQVPAASCQKVLPEEDLTTLTTMCVAYMTAVYALDHMARIRLGETVLIHSAAGGVGLAAIDLARARGAEVYATVGSELKKDFLHKNFGIPLERIFYSRSHMFVHDVMQATGGRGVDITLSALTGDLMHESWSCTAPFGRFIDIGRREVLDHGKLDMAVFQRNAVFHSFDLGELYWERQDIFSGVLSEVLDLYRTGKISPTPPSQSYDISELSTALRSLMKGDHIGKIAVNYNLKSTVLCRASENHIDLNPEGAYLVIGGFGGVGRSLISWMLRRGARNFVLLSPNPPSNPADDHTVKEVISVGGMVNILRGDASVRADVSRAIAAAQRPLKGVVHTAMVLRDRTFQEMNANEFNLVVNTKLRALMHLHELLPKDLDFLVALSSLAATVGGPSQSNYAAANAAVDAMARIRSGLGLPFASIGLGPITGLGYLHSRPEIMRGLERLGFPSLTEEDILLAIETGIRWQLQPGEGEIGLNAEPIGKPSSRWILAGLELDRLREPKYRENALACLTLDLRMGVLARALQDDVVASEVKKSGTFLDEVTVALKTGKQTAHATLASFFLDKLAKVLLLPVESLDLGSTLTDYGLDSMIGGEIRVWLFREFGVEVSFLDLTDPRTRVETFISNILAQIEVHELPVEELGGP